MSEQDRNLMVRARNLLSQVDVNSSQEYLASCAALCEELTATLAYERIPCAIVREDTGRKWAELMQDMPPGSLLYAKPQPDHIADASKLVEREPLTEEQIVRIYERPELAGTRHESGTAKAIAIARAVERAHGIEKEPSK